MRVALTGVSGFIGSHTARRLHAAGHQVTGMVRASSRRDHVEAFVDRFVEGGHDDERCFDALLRDADVVIHNSVDFRAFASDAYARDVLNRDLVWSLRLLAASAPQPFVYVSSVAAIHDVLPRWNHLIEEDHPSRPAGTYGAFKAAIEAYLWAEHHGRGRRIAIVRPSGVYGLAPVVERSHGYAIISDVRDGKPFTQPGGGKFVHVEDVADMLAVCAEKDATNGHVFNLADCYARWADWAKLAADELGVDVPIDMSSPEQAKNRFSKAPASDFGVALDRGHEGIRAHLRELIKLM